MYVAPPALLGEMTADGCSWAMPFVGLTQHSESVRFETVCSAIVYWVRIGPRKQILFTLKDFLNPTPSEFVLGLLWVILCLNDELLR